MITHKRVKSEIAVKQRHDNSAQCYSRCHTMINYQMRGTDIKCCGRKINQCVFTDCLVQAADHGAGYAFLRTSAPAPSFNAILKFLVARYVSSKWHQCPHQNLCPSRSRCSGMVLRSPKRRRQGTPSPPTEAVTHIFWFEAVVTWP